MAKIYSGTACWTRHFNQFIGRNKREVGIAGKLDPLGESSIGVGLNECLSVLREQFTTIKYPRDGVAKGSGDGSDVREGTEEGMGRCCPLV